MSPSDIDASVHRQLGEIAAGMHAVQDAVRRVEEAARRSEDKSDASRTVVHRRLDEVATQVSDLKSDVAAAKSDLADAKRVTDDVKRWRLMGIGALAVVGIGGTALGVALAGILEQVAAFFKGH